MPHRALQCVAHMPKLRAANLSAFALTPARGEAQAENACDSPVASPHADGVLAQLATLSGLTRLDLRWCRVRTPSPALRRACLTSPIL